MPRAAFICIGVILSSSLTLGWAQSFQAPPLIPTAMDPLSLTTGDLNHDGKPDFVFADGGVDGNGANLHVLLGNGNGSFTHGLDLQMPAGICACSIQLADVNNDGHLDVILDGFTADAYRTTAEVAVLPGNGDGSFGSPIVSTFSSGASIYPRFGKFAVGDVSGDGAPDLILPDSVNTQLYILKGDNTGHFQYVTVLPQGGYPSEAFLADLNGDGHPDIVALGPTGGLFTVYLNNGAGMFGNGVNYNAGPGPMNMVLADLDGDGRLDVTTIAYQMSANNQTQYQVLAFLGKGDGTFATPVTVFSPIQGMLIDIADYNGDGKLDLLVANTLGIAILTGKGGLSFNSPLSFAAGGAAIPDIVFGDFNGDGHRDIALGVEGGIQLLDGQGDGTFSTVTTYDLGQPVGATAVADFNSDGNPDIAVSVPATFPRVLLGKGDGTFQPANDQNTSYGPPPAGSNAAVGDFNGDGKQDLLAGSYAGTFGFDEPALYFGNGQGSFAAPVDENHGGVAVVDFNNDHRSDMITILDTNILVSLGQADGTFRQVTTALRVPTFAKLSAIGDFNRDGIPDLAIADQAGLEIWLGNGDGTFTFSNLIDMTRFGSIGAGNFGSTIVVDLDGDGFPDLVLGPDTYVSNSVFTVLYGKGNGLFGAPLFYPLSHPYPAITAADVNKDGMAELVFHDGAGIAVIPNRGNRTFGPEQHYVANASIGTLSIADFNDDGYPDLVVSNYGGTAVTVLLNAGSSSTASTNAVGQINISPEPSGSNQPFVASLTLSAPTQSGPAPTGTVTFEIDGHVAAVAAITGATTAFTEAQALTPGTHTITATYNGDSTYGGETFAVLHTVSVPVYVTNTSLTVEPATVLASQTVRMQVKVTSNGPIPFGAVTFLDGTNSLGNLQLDATGSALFDTALLSAGIHSISARYVGYDGSDMFIKEIFQPSTSAASAVTVNNYATTTSLSTSSSTATSGTVLTLTANVGSASAAPFGGVTFFDGSNPLGTSALTGGSATFSTPSLTIGTHALTAAFNANGPFGTSVSQQRSVTIQQVSSSLKPTITSLNLVSGVASNVSLIARTSSSSGQPHGNVTFLMDGKIIGAAVTDADGVATLVNTQRPGAGQHTFFASFGGTANSGSSASPALIQTWTSSGTRFAISSMQTSATVSPSVPAVIALQIAFPASQTAEVRLSCASGLPVGYVCDFSPAVLTAGGGSRLTISSSNPTADLVIQSTLGLCCVLALLVPGTGRRTYRWIAVFLLYCSFHLLTGCVRQSSGTSNGNATVLTVQGQSISGDIVSVQSVQISLRLVR